MEAEGGVRSLSGLSASIVEEQRQLSGRPSGLRGGRERAASRMGLLTGLLRARKLLLVILVPLLLLPLPMLHPSSVSTVPSPPGASRAGGRSRTGGGWRERGAYAVAQCACLGLKKWKFSWGRLKCFLPKNCHFHPSVSFRVSHPGVKLEERPLIWLVCVT